MSPPPSLIRILLFIIYSFQLCMSSILKDQSLRQNERSDKMDVSQLKYLVLGDYNHDINIDINSKQSYPYLLSNIVTNLSIKNLELGPKLPSTCIKSLIGHDNHDIYDVIILDYKLHQVESNRLDILAQRLRTRYPNAIIILNMMWIPDYIIATTKTNEVIEVMPLRELWKNYNFTSPITAQHTSILNDHIIKFQLDPILINEYLPILKQIKNDIKGHLLGLGQWSSSYWNNKDWVFVKLLLFHDLYHYTTKGHEYVASALKKTILKLYKPSNQIGSWGLFDESCHLWYHTGDTTHIAFRSSKIMRLNQFQPLGYALEIAHGSRGQVLLVHNPFTQPRSLLLSYMATSASDVYPKIEVKINHARDRSYLIDPFMHHSNNKNEFIMSTDLGSIPPGRALLNIKTICEPSYKLPLRLVGVSIVSNTFKFPKATHLLWDKPEKVIAMQDRKQRMKYDMQNLVAL